MTGYQTYTLILCLIVFVMLTLLSVLVIAVITKQQVKLINCGAEDEEILANYKKELNKKKSKLGKVLDCGLTLLLGLIFVVAFAGSTIINCSQNAQQSGVPIFRVVKTDSMASKHVKNTYLETYGLHTQFQSMDLILTHKLPDEKDLRLYDVVVYETSGVLLVHRIVGIEEPNAKHPNERHFLLQGDAVDAPDRFPVLYSQMRGIYYGERVPFVGSFVLFLQSPAGWLCLLLVVISVIVAPLLENYLKKKRDARLAILLGLPEEEEAHVEEVAQPKAEEKAPNVFRANIPSVVKVKEKEDSVCVYLSVKPKALDGHKEKKEKQYLLRVNRHKKTRTITPNQDKSGGGV